MCCSINGISAFAATQLRSHSETTALAFSGPAVLCTVPRNRYKSSISPNTNNTTSTDVARRNVVLV